MWLGRDDGRMAENGRRWMAGFWMLIGAGRCLIGEEGSGQGDAGRWGMGDW